MQSQSVIILLGCLILATFLIFFIVFVVQFTKRRYKHKLEIQNIKIQQQKEQLINSVSAMEAERSRIGRDIHDDISPLLTALQLSNQGIALKHNLPSEDLNSQSEILQSLYSSIRAMSRSLYPFALKRFGISKAIEDLAHLITQTSGIKVNLDISSFPENMEFERQLAFYRIIQEFCHNSLRHSSCTEISIVARTEDQHEIISISDDGIGFDMQNINEGLGLKNMEMRSEIAGFDYELSSKLKEGTSLKITYKTES